MNLHAPTVEFTTALFDHYVEEPYRRPPIVTGSHLPVIDQAKEETRRQWLEFFGVEIPESLTFREYLLSSDEKQQRDDLTSRMLATTTSQTIARNFRYPGDQSHLIALEAADIRKRVYDDLLSYDETKPCLQFEEPLQSGYPLQSSVFKSQNVGVGYDCAVTVFGMNAVRLVQTDISPGANFDSASAARTIEAKYSAQGSRLDLVWLLGSLGTQFVTTQSGYEVRSIVSIGADFQDIEQKIIQPLRKKDPSLQFMVNAVISSETVKNATHAVNIMNGDKNTAVRVIDPKHRGYRDMPKYYFWQKWILTNMQAAITVIRPRQ